MPLPPGVRLGPYEVTAAIGAGGMGEVYRGRDATLNRDAAIKVLPAALAGDAERLARFKREAQVLASLNHSNIAQIYGFDGATLADGSTAHFLAMEMVEGEDLAERLKRGPIPVEEALAIARQIADGLEEAHERGIIHRDLKPANVKVTPDGKVKILDFGLAKALEGDPATSGPKSQLSHSPTMSRHMTEAGMIMGTAAYMSPEQARGKTVDRRADIWAFGVVLFEMLAGTRLFAGETVSDTLAAVLKTDPDFGLLPPDTSPTVRRFLRRCLEKDGKRRLGWIGGFRHELDEAGSVERETTLSRPSGPAWRRALPFAAAVTAGAALAGLFFSLTGRGRVDPGAGPVARLTLETSSRPVTLAISPDGRRVFLGMDSGIEIRSISEFEAVPLKAASLPNNRDVTFSPDGESIAFTSGTMLKTLSLAGGVVRDVADFKETAAGCSWSGEHLYCGLGASGIARVKAGGGRVEPLAGVEPGECAGTPRLLPGEDTLLFTLAPSIGAARCDWQRASVVIKSMSSGKREVVAASGYDPRYLASGHIAYAVEGVWYALPFDAKAGRVLGPPVPVIQGIARGAQAGLFLPRAIVDVSEAGTLVYVPGPMSLLNEREIVLADRGGKERVLKLPPKLYEAPRVSPDGGRLAFSVNGQDEAAVWIYDLSESFAVRRLTFGGRNRIPLWSPDGKRVAFQSDRGGDVSIWVQAADGSGEAERLTTADKGETHVPEWWSRDGGLLGYTRMGRERAELWTRTMDDGKVARFSDIHSNAPLNSAISPDGKWVAYTLRGLTEAPNSVFVQPVPATGARYQVSGDRDAAHHPFWTPDGKDLFFWANGGGTLVSASIGTAGGLTVGRPAVAEGEHPSNTSALGTLNYDMTPDGRHFVFSRRISSGAEAGDGRPDGVKVVLNWFEELKRLAPGKP